MSDHDEFGAFLVGFIVGGLTGAVAALLFAPQSGEETRATIKEKSIELKDQALVETDKAIKQAEAVAAEVRVKVEDLSKKAYQQGEEISLKAKKAGEELVETAKEKVKKIAPKKTDVEIDAATEI
jgi:gas vesicle protein